MEDGVVARIVEQYFPPTLRQRLTRLGAELEDAREIRCRAERPLLVLLPQGKEIVAAERLSAEELRYLVSRISQGSAYAWEEEFRQGYLTLPGGHRVGMAGKGVLEQGHVRTMKEINALNFRIARAVPGAADALLPLVTADGGIANTLLIAPPGGGKTTVLRDLICQLSDGAPERGRGGVSVGLVDERSELAGCVAGVPQLWVGARTDVLDGCPKSEGIRMLIRSMGPRVVAADEIGAQADALALEEALQSGVAVLTTAHGRSFDEVCRHPVLGSLLQRDFFPLVVFLHWRDGRLRFCDRRGERL